jgi:hypothetical protein
LLLLCLLRLLLRLRDGLLRCLLLWRSTAFHCACEPRCVCRWDACVGAVDVPSCQWGGRG